MVLIPVSAHASRKMESESAPLPVGCPRCGVRLGGHYKYCPNCAYRLRPELVDSPAPALRRSSLAERLVSLGGYLAFGSLLLLVLLAGIRLFVEDTTPRGGVQRSVTRPRDANAFPLERTDFVHIPGGIGLFGLYYWSPDGENEVPTAFRVDDAFELGKYEVTNDQYYEFLQAWASRGGQPVPRNLYPAYWNRATGRAGVEWIYDADHGNYPVTSVDARAAQQFCAWFWEERLDADPNVVVDLPTAREWVLAARGAEAVENNFPWGATFDERKAVLRGAAEPVNSPRTGVARGMYGLVGNVAEWVYDPDVGIPVAAGWSFENGDVAEDWLNQERRSPFSLDEMEAIPNGEHQPHVGFRLAIRRAPALPTMVKVEPGAVRHGPPPPGIYPPEVDAARLIVQTEPPEVGEEIQTIREDPITFPGGAGEVEDEFEIARTEITNRQYLAFLEAVSPELTPAEVGDLLPWREQLSHDNPMPTDAMFPGIYGDPLKIKRLYDPGRENHPVEGVSIDQVDAYATWLSRRLPEPGGRFRIPTADEFVRAGRGDADWPYPWGGDPLDPALVCAGRRDSEGRAVSLLGRLGANAPRIVGLAGNLPEFVSDPPRDRLLLAGGCYEFQAESCTLDSFLSAAWQRVMAMVPAPEGFVDKPFMLENYAGFRVVRTIERP